MRSVPQLLNENLVAIDIFPFNPEGNEYERPQRSLIGALGSIVTLCICFAIIVNSFAKFARDEVSRSIQIRAQTDNDTSEIEDMGVIIFVDGEPFYDERFFRIRYRYRAIYNGDQQNDIRPRVYINIPTKTCLLYKDENSPGKNATLGCPDLHAATKLLAAKKDILIQDDKISKKDIAQFPVFPIIQGKYGSDVYWFMEINILSCEEYREEANITCVNSTDVQKKFEKHTSGFDFVFKSHVSRTQQVWQSMYRQLEVGRWTGVELYFMKTHSFETDRFLERTTKNHMNYTSHIKNTNELRTTKRTKGVYINIYIRMYAEFQEEKLVHFSFFEMLNSIGGAWEVVVVFMSIIFISYNFLQYRWIKKNSKSHNE